MLVRAGMRGIIRALAGAFVRLADHTLGAVAESTGKPGLSGGQTRRNAPFPRVLITETGGNLMRIIARLVVGFTLAASATGCALFDDRCGERSKDVGATGRITNPDDPAAGFVQLTLVETESTEPRQSGYWLFKDESLRGHVTAARLRGPDGGLLVELDVTSSISTDVTYSGQLAPYSGVVPFATLYAMVLEGNVTIVLRTDVAGRDSLSTKLGVVHANPWRQPHCS